MILLTGGAGFIGSCFLKKLNDDNRFDILVVDHLGSGCKWKNLLGKKFFRYINKDEFETEVLEYYDIETIVHFGACTNTTENDADYMLQNNLDFSINLAEYALWKNIRFIYASSAATYGDGKNGYSDSEFNDLKPLNPYGLSKHLFDLWLINNNALEKVSGIKFFNVFGPNEYHKDDMASMIYKAYNQIVSTGKVRLFKSYLPEIKDGEQERDFVYIKDVIEVLWKIFNKEDIKGIYNLGSGTARTWNDLANSVFEAMDVEPKIEYIDMPDSLKNQYQYYTKADMSKLKKIIPGMSFNSLENNVFDYVRNYLMKDLNNY